jgi:hypothetical protein
MQGKFWAILKGKKIVLRGEKFEQIELIILPTATKYFLPSSISFPG